MPILIAFHQSAEPASQPGLSADFLKAA